MKCLYTLRARICAFAVAVSILCATTLTAQGPPGPKGFPGGPKGGPGGFKGGPGGPKGGPRFGDAEQDALDRLRLTGSVKEKSQRLLDSHTRATMRMLDKARRDFLTPMKELLTVDQYVEFQDSLSARPGGAQPVSVDDMIQRVLANDKNKTGKVCKEDLPERMQHLVALGDANKDGYLDRDEIKQLAIKVSNQSRPGPGFGPGPGQGRPFNAPDADRALAKLSLTGAPRDKARSLLDTFKQATRTIGDERREDLVTQMKDVLSDTQLKQFKDVLESRPRRPA
jgi:Spy/CpxP family protein refolding chaperone